ncbi:MAG TPA: inositol monophosphatase family protein [Candidatus Aminicenantes bacterium]|nr:inositol monophosphatase family protein [Candidatus Aminicenantes bacterium]
MSGRRPLASHPPARLQAPGREAQLRAALSAARAAGTVIRRGFRCLEAGDVRAKGVNDFVTRVDLEAEAAIRKVIAARFPGHNVLAEEMGGQDSGDGPLWVIDPLDGTTNFIHGIPQFAVSLALLEGGRSVFGLIHEPLSGDIFRAAAGGGAFLNDRPIAVSRTDELAGALGATGFPFKAPAQRPAYARAFAALLERCQDMRRCGAAALDLAYVACGRFDFFWEAHLLPWDFLAGKLIVEEAGGRTGDFAGEALSLKTGSVLAANPRLYPVLQAEIGRYFNGPSDKFIESSIEIGERSGRT